MTMLVGVHTSSHFNFRFSEVTYCINQGNPGCVILIQIGEFHRKYGLYSYKARKSHSHPLFSKFHGNSQLRGALNLGCSDLGLTAPPTEVRRFSILSI